MGSAGVVLTAHFDELDSFILLQPLVQLTH
jgi:hypothetical protein